MSDREYYGKEEEKEHEKEEEKGGQSWDEKWRRDPVDAATWAFIFIWAGLVLLAGNMGILANLLGPGVEAWSVGFIGAGLIVLLGVVVRVLVPAYRRPLIGGLIFAVILIGIGLGEVIGWVAIGPLVLIAIGVGVLLGGILRRR
jgi:hypothetical protein